MSISKYTYDAAGRLTEKTDRNGRVTTYTYDAAGRLTSESWLDSSDNIIKSFVYTYDTVGNLLTVTDGVSSYVYTYDTMNRIDSKIILFDAQMAVFSYTYDTLGRQTESSLRLNGVQDRTINIEYDYLGRALSAELTGNALNDILAEFDYNAVGALTDVRRFEWDDTDELYNLIALSQYQYNARNQITSITHQDSNNNNIVSHGYLYDADGNISQYTNSLDGSVLYDYDFLGQLTGADYSNLNIPDESYQYDLNGNRELVTNANGDLVVYSTGLNNELNSDGNYSYTYDAEGNRISKTNAAGTERELYTWDYRNRLSSVTKQEYNATTQEWQTVQIVEYAYDYNNVLIRKVLDANGDGTADSKTLFLPENYQTAIQLDDTDLSDSTYETVSHRYLWTPGQQDKLLADIQVSPTDSETLWTLTDHLGTIRDIIQQTPTGLIQKAHVIYDAYGNVLSCKDANGTDIESPVLFGFTGKYFDADTQLQNNVNRWYDAATGRWLSIDPIGFNGNDTNLYRYVGNNSNNLLDYLGLYLRGLVKDISEQKKCQYPFAVYCFQHGLQNNPGNLYIYEGQTFDPTINKMYDDVIKKIRDDKNYQNAVESMLKEVNDDYKVGTSFYMSSDNSKYFRLNRVNIPVKNPDLFFKNDEDLFYSLYHVNILIEGDIICESGEKRIIYTVYIKDRYDFDSCCLTHFPYLGGYYGGSYYGSSTYYGGSSSYYSASFWGGLKTTAYNEGAVALQFIRAMQNYEITIQVENNSEYPKKMNKR